MCANDHGEPPWSIEDVNTWDLETFTARLGFIFEQSPWIAAAAWPRRPFASVAALEQSLGEVMRNASPEAQLALIRAHPDLVGRAALNATLTPLSTGEQAAAGLDPNRLSADDIKTFTELNDAYQARFGFPFVICARENKKSRILTGFRTRLGNRRDDEVATALAEIAKIGHYRLLDVVQE
jgi:OHCU decarboxylase